MKTGRRKVFISYAHSDEELREQLDKHLAGLERQGVIEAWHDRNIDAGKEWKDSIDENLNDADIILLLISSDFIDSTYCYEIEMARALERHRNGEAVVVPVIVRPVEWQGMPFSELQALPKGAKAITTWPNRDEAFADVAAGIRRIVEEPSASIVEEPPTPPKPTPRLRFSIIVSISITVAILLTIPTSRCLVTHGLFGFGTPQPVITPTPIYETATEFDDLLEEQPRWTPVDLGWKLDYRNKGSEQAYGRIITGDRIGLFKTAQSKNQFNTYKNFTLLFDARFIGKKGVAWIVRAKDFQHYYLFELAKSAGHSPTVLNFYVVDENGRGQVKDSRPVQIVDVENDWDNYAIMTVAIESEFKVNIRRTSTSDPANNANETLLPIIYDAYEYGGVGFLPKDGREILLQQLRIEPHPQ